MIDEAGCQPDEKLYTVLGRGCLQAGFLAKAAKVIRAAYQLPGHGMAVPKRGVPCGVEAKLLEEVVSTLNSGNKAEKELANDLVVDLKEHRGVNAVQNSVYARVAQQAASGGSSRGGRGYKK